jgi:flagellar hook-length control protein FliK
VPAAAPAAPEVPLPGEAAPAPATPQAATLSPATQPEPLPEPAAAAVTAAVPAWSATIAAAPPAAVTAAPVAPAQIPSEPRQGVRLAQAAETVRLTIATASSAGVSHARIALRPAELGGIEIMLSHGPGGLSATVTAESPAAAHALQRAADQLQRSLADQGLSLVRLDIDVAGDRSAQSRRDDRERSARRGQARAGADDGTDLNPTPTVERTLELPGGVLVDVLA